MIYILIGCFTFLVLMDQISKAVAVQLLGNVGASCKFIPHILRLEYRENTGMAWGLLKDARIFFIIITLLLCGLMLFFMIKQRKNMPKLVSISLSVILAGAVGNFIDRVFLGYVRDFLAFDFFDFPVFNLADSYVTIGASLLIIVLFFTKQGKAFIKYLESEEDARIERHKDRNKQNAE